MGITVLGNYTNSGANHIGQLKASVAKGFRFKGIDVTAAAGVDRLKNHLFNPMLRFNTGLNLKIKQLEIGYSFISSATNGLINGHNSIFTNNYIPSLHSLSTSYSLNIRHWFLQPSIYYSRIANFTQFQLQAIAVYNSKWVLGLSSSQSDPTSDWYGIIVGYKANHIELTFRPQLVISDWTDAPIFYNAGFSYHFGSNK